jgi:hypothetical protein
MFGPISISLNDYFSMMIENQGIPKPLFYSRLKVLFPLDFGRKNVQEMGSKLSISAVKRHQLLVQFSQISCHMPPPLPGTPPVNRLTRSVARGALWDFWMQLSIEQPNTATTYKSLLVVAVTRQWWRHRHDF